MGYSHYLLRPANLGSHKKFDQFVADVKKIVDYCQKSLGIKLGDGMGEKEPQITSEFICVNGHIKQPKGIWTTPKNISIPWPSPSASLTEPSVDPIDEKTDGQWFAGDLVSSRVAPLYNDDPDFAAGDYEPIDIDKNLPEEEKTRKSKIGLYESGLYFTSCKTAYRPYDLTVTAILIAVKHHFPKCVVKTDGQEKDWLDGMFLCNNLLGYGMSLEIDTETKIITL